MWKIVLDFFELFGWVILGVAAVMAIGFLVLFTKAIIELAIADEEVKKLNEQENCIHDNLQYTESHPEKVWTCNDCGKII